MTFEEIRQLPANDPISREEFETAMTLYESRRAAALSSVNSLFQTSDIEQLRGDAAKLKEAGSETALILAYQDLDQRLVIAEEAISAATDVADGAIQYATDVARGK